MYVDKGSTARKMQNSGPIKDLSAFEVLALYLLFGNSSKQRERCLQIHQKSHAFSWERLFLKHNSYVSCAARQIWVSSPGSGSTWVSYRELSSQFILLQPPIILRTGKP